MSNSPNGFEYALQSTSLPGLIIVCVLGALSVLAWTIIITKSITLRRARRRNSDFMVAYSQIGFPLEFYQSGYEVRHSPLFRVHQAACRELCLQLVGKHSCGEDLAARLLRLPRVAPSQLQAVRYTTERAIGEIAQRLEERMNLLATCVSGAPFLGLLGTVWGVMDTFAAVASAPGGASLQDMAPGVSAALVTTVVGLLVAIPAMFGYNTLIQSIRNMTLQLDHHAADLGAAFERHYVDHGRAPRAGTTAPAAPASAATHPATAPPRPAPARESDFPFEYET